MAHNTDGGPAFPTEKRVGLEPYTRERMEPVGGMSLRDYFAAKALPQAIAHERDVRASMIAPEPFRFDAVAEAAYATADAMLRARAAQSPADTQRAHLDEFGK